MRRITFPSQIEHRLPSLGKAFARLVAGLLVLGLVAVSFPRATSAAVDVGYRDYFYGDNTKSPTEDKNESKLWYHAGAWWAIMLNPTSLEWHAYRLDWDTQTWQDSGAVLDTQKNARADVLWDGSKLYTVARSPGVAPMLRRFSYDGGTQTYSLDDGFPVAVSDRSPHEIVLAKDSLGALWVTYQVDDKIYVNHTAGDDATWGTPYALPFAEAVGLDDLSSIVAFGRNKVGVLWGNQLDGHYYFAWHADGALDDEWTLETAEGDALAADDHINLKAGDDGRVYAAVKTSKKGTCASLVELLVRETDGTWNKHTFGTKCEDHTVPMLLLDEENDMIYLFAVAPGGADGGGSVYMKSSPMDEIAFASGFGEAFIFNNLSPKTHNPTSTKQNLNGDTDLVVLAADGSSKYYLHNTLNLPGGAPKTLTVASASVEDGYVIETTETSGVGGAVKSTGGKFRVGDDAANKQYRGILSFDTSVLPDNAVITLVQIRIKRLTFVGTDPFTTHTSLIVDVKDGPFGGAALESADFQATASVKNAGSFGAVSNGQWSTATLSASGTASVNRTGITQFRIRFKKDDNNDAGADYVNFASGDTLTAAHRPQLVVTYSLP